MNCIVNGNMKFVRLILVRPQQCKYIWFCSKHLFDSFKVKIGKIDVNAQWDCFTMFDRIAADLNIRRIEIFYIYSALHPILNESDKREKQKIDIKITSFALEILFCSEKFERFFIFSSRHQKSHDFFYLPHGIDDRLRWTRNCTLCQR